MRVAENATQKQLIQCLSHVTFKKVVLSNFHRDIFTRCCLSLFLYVLSFETSKNTKSHCKSLLISSATILIFIESENLISIVLDF